MENRIKEKGFDRCEHESTLVIKRSELFEELVKIRESNKTIYEYIDTGISPEELYYHKYADKDYKKVMLREWRFKKLKPKLIWLFNFIELSIITGVLYTVLFL